MGYHLQTAAIWARIGAYCALAGIVGFVIGYFLFWEVWGLAAWVMG